MEIHDGFEPIASPSPTTVRNAEGEVIKECATHAEAWYHIIESGQNPPHMGGFSDAVSPTLNGNA